MLTFHLQVAKDACFYLSKFMYLLNSMHWLCGLQEEKAEVLYIYRLSVYCILSLINFALEKLWTCVWLFVPAAKGQTHLIQPKSLTVAWPHGVPFQMQPSLEAQKTSGHILGRCFLSCQGSVDLQVTEVAWSLQVSWSHMAQSLVG